MDNFFKQNAQAKSIYEKHLESTEHKIEKFRKSKLAKEIEAEFPDAKLLSVTETE